MRYGITDVIERPPYVAVVADWTAVGRRSGIAVGGRSFTVWTFRDDLVISIAHHWGVAA